jgi:hypothetical protein
MLIPFQNTNHLRKIEINAVTSIQIPNPDFMLEELSNDARIISFVYCRDGRLSIPSL